MSQRLNRRRISPVRIRPTTEQRRTNLNADIQRIVNHASKLLVEYNKTSIEKVMEADINNHAKVNLLLKASKESFPKILVKSNSEKSKAKRKRNQSSSANYHSENERESDRPNLRDSKYSRSPEYSQEFLNSSKIESYKSLNISKKSTSPSLDLFVDVNEKRTNTPMTASSAANDKSRDTSKEIMETKRSTESKDSLPNLSSIQKSSQQSAMDLEKPINEHESIFIYELEIKTNDKLNSEFDANIWIHLNGECARTDDPILINDLFREQHNSKPFQAGNIARLTVSWKESLGMIESIKVVLDSKAEKSLFFLDYVLVKDCSSEKDYIFSCGRWLGTNSPDKLSKITLAWLPPLEEELKSSEEKLVPKIHEEKESISNKIIKLESFGTMSGPHNPHNEKETQSSLSQRTSESSEFEPTDSEINNEIIETPHLVEPSDFLKKSIHQAIEDKDFLLVKELCDSDRHLKDATDHNGYSPIHLAAIQYQENSDSRKILDYLLSLSVDINQVSVDGYVSLHYAIINGNLAAVKYLIENGGAEPNVLDRAGNTPLQLATEYGFHKIIDYLEKINVEELSEQSGEFLENEIRPENDIEEVIVYKVQTAQESHSTQNRLNNTIMYSENEESEEQRVNDLTHDKNEYQSDTEVKVVPSNSVMKEQEDTNTTELRFIGGESYENNNNKEHIELETENDNQIASDNILENEAIPPRSDEELNNLSKSKRETSSTYSDESHQVNKSENMEDLSSETNKSKKSVNRRVSMIAFQENDDSNILEILEDNHLEEEVVGIMFHKTIPLSNYPKNPTPKNENNSRNTMKTREEEISPLSSESKATSLVSSRPESISTISPRSNSSGNSSETVSNIQQTLIPDSNNKDKMNDSTDKTNVKEPESTKTNKPLYSRKETTDQLGIELMKYEPFPTIDEPHEHPNQHLNGNAVEVLPEEPTN